MLVRRAEILAATPAVGPGPGTPRADLVDVRLAGGTVVEIGPPGRRLDRRPGEEEFDAAGGALLPGLHDHHLHLMSLAASMASVFLGPPAVADAREFARRLGEAAGAARRSPRGGWVRGIGYHPATAGDLDRWALDALTGDVPTRVQHRGGALWVLNSAALREVGLSPHAGVGVGVGVGVGEGIERTAAGTPTGRLWRLDSWLAARVPRVAVDLGALGRAALAAGVTGFTDATPERRPSDRAALAEAVVAGVLPQRLTLMRSSAETELPVRPGTCGPDGAWAPGGAPERLRSGWESRLTAGPLKIMLDDTDLPDPDRLAERVRAAHRSGVPVAVHCVTRVQLVVTLAAIEAARPSAGGAPATATGLSSLVPGRPADRIEHGAVIPPELATLIRAAGLTVVTQPNFVAERGDAYLAEVDPDDIPWLYPCRSLLAAGIAVAAGTDAPFGHPDPWRAVRAAVHRRTPAGTLLGAAERVDGRSALDLFLGHPESPARPRRICLGMTADLCLLRVPLDEALANPQAADVAATFIDGTLAYAAS
ncbi:amidohydrolase [Parafrankia colletiae]|uniref:Amidohydrolase n=1 Tax=Parafrankia colletiae TaxID=573497 RepID=A0A1S1QR98_9ACTN|nr:amidohydrolase family protein [Parafrankia colletiae]OHV36227.1 amidohydrolase [Parafrankia colletiae]